MAMYMTVRVALLYGRGDGGDVPDMVVLLH